MMWSHTSNSFEGWRGWGGMNTKMWRRLQRGGAGLKNGQNGRLSDVLTVGEKRATFRCRGRGHGTKDLYSSGARVTGVNPCSVSLYARVDKIVHKH